MKRLIKSRPLLLLVIVLLLSSCGKVPITGRSQLNLVPDSIINKMSLQSYSEFLSENKLSSNAEQTSMVKRVGQRIATAVEKYCRENDITDRVNGYQWEFNLVESEEVNAWCAPGGKVVVYTGLIPVAKSETGLAVVMGHEIAHAIAKHGSERMTQGLIVELGGIGLSKALEQYSEKTQGIFMKSFALGTTYGVLLPYSRTHESEADHMGLIFMAMAGYDPNEAVAFWQRMADAKQGASPPELLSTHPADSTRIKNIQKQLPEAMGYYNKTGATP